MAFRKLRSIPAAKLNIPPECQACLIINKCACRCSAACRGVKLTPEQAKGVFKTGQPVRTGQPVQK